MNIKVYLNPNPAFCGETLTDPHGTKYEMKNKPFLELEFHNFPEGEYSVQILSPFNLEKKLKVKSPCVSLYFLDHRFEDPTLPQVRVKVEGKEVVKEMIFPTIVHKLKGRVCNFNGDPSFGYIWACREGLVKYEIIVRSDEKGNFTLYYPEGRRLRVFVGDITYGKTSLECWIMGDELKSDVEINPHIGGNFELYELKVWSFNNIWNIFFLPAVVNSEIPPALKKEDVKVWINDVEGEIKSFTSHKVFFSTKKGGVYHPAYIMNVVVDKLSSQIYPPVIIKVRIDSPQKGKGEALYIYY